MNTLKTIIISATMLAIGYGTHIVLNRQPGDHDLLSETNIWNQNNVELPGIPNGAANIELPAFDAAPASAPSENPFGVHPSSSTTSNDNPFGNRPRTDVMQTPTTSLVDVPRSDSLGTSALGSSGRPDLSIPQSQPLSSATIHAPPMPTLPTTVATPPPSGAAPLGSMNPPASQMTIPGVTDVSMSTPPAGASAMNFNEPVGLPSNPSVATTSATGTTAPYAAQPNMNANLSNANQTSATFATTWQSAQSQIGSGQFANALATLTSIYNQPMDNAQRGQLVSLLDQLAGTVIYSQQHLLHPAYAPRNGETIAEVAARQRITADFLARVNGTNPHLPLNPNMKLKVITGPFRAELSHSRRELTVFLGTHYAGRFAVSIGSDFPQQATTFEVFEKAGARAYTDPRTGQQIPAGHPANPYGAHWIGLQSGGAPIAGCGLHAVGGGLDASDSRGCIGLSSQDVDDLKAILDLGSTITVVQ